MHLKFFSKTKTRSFFKAFSTNVTLFYFQKTSEKLPFFDISRRYRSGTVVENGFLLAAVLKPFTGIGILKTNYHFYTYIFRPESSNYDLWITKIVLSNQQHIKIYKNNNLGLRGLKRSIELYLECSTHLSQKEAYDLDMSAQRLKTFLIPV